MWGLELGRHGNDKKLGKMQAGEEEGVQQGDKIKSSCGNGRLHERKEKSN